MHEHRDVVDTGGESGRHEPVTALLRVRTEERGDVRPGAAERCGPTKRAGAPEPGFGYAHTWTASTPVPLAAARSVAHPATRNGWPTVWLLPGASIDIRGLAFTWTVTVRASANVPVTVECANATIW